MNLPLAKRDAKPIYLASKDSLLKAMDIATLPETAKYLLEQFIARLRRAKLENEAGPVLEKVNEYVKNVELQYASPSDPWNGRIDALFTDFQNLQRNLAEDSVQVVAANVFIGLHLDIAISDLSELLRGYSVDGVAVNNELLVALDRLFNAWLADKNLLSQGSTIYECNEHGEIIKDGRGQPVKVDAEQVRALLVDPEQGYERYLGDKGIFITLAQHPYPTAEPVVEPIEAVMDVEEEMPEPQTPEVEPASSSPGAAGG